MRGHPAGGDHRPEDTFEKLDNQSAVPRVLGVNREGVRPLDEHTIRIFLETTYPRLVVAVALASGSYAVAEDAVQEALVRAWTRSERGEQIESLPGWVAAVALNLTRKGLRRVLAERRARQRVHARTLAAVPASTGELIDVQRALARLPRRQRETAVLRYVLEMDTREVAQVLGIDEGTVKSHLARARSKLMRELEVSDLEVSNDAGT
jgi:RNA polymerase sigma-70 factor (ECF subfamily)